MMRMGARPGRAPSAVASIMSFTIPDHVSFCMVGDEPVFLDVNRDRYFRLEPKLAAVFSQLCTTDGAAARYRAELARLLQTRVVVPSSEDSPPQPARDFIPDQSLVEEFSPLGTPRARLTVEMLIGLLHVRRAIRRGRLPALLRRVRENKADLDLDSSPTAASLVTCCLASRRLLPIAPNCLTDSLALSSLLIRRRIPFELVFGVRLSPFAAHCWLQNSEFVFNDSLGSVLDFKPILVI